MEYVSCLHIIVVFMKIARVTSGVSFKVSINHKFECSLDFSASVMDNKTLLHIHPDYRRYTES